VTSATLSNEIQSEPNNRPNLVAVGTIVWLSSELMFFAALFAMYFTVRSVEGPKVWLQSTGLLNVPFATLNTTVLVLSSVTCQFGVFAAERFQLRRTGKPFDFRKWGMREWFTLTFLMGAFFVSGQIYEYVSLVRDGITMASRSYGSVFYITTGFHGLHVAGGLVAFLIVLGRTFKAHRFGHAEATTAIVVSY
jgi:cytochrome c oxidase subunit 3